MSQADIGVNVFLIDAFSSPMGALEGAMALLASGLMNTASQFEQLSGNMGVFAEQMAEQEALMEAANQGFQDMGLAIQDAKNEITRLQNAGPMINQAALTQAQDDLDYYEEKCRITQLKIDALQMGPIPPSQQAANDIALANAELQLDRYEQKVATTQAKIQGINDAATIKQTSDIADQNLAIDAAIAQQNAFGASSQNAANNMMAISNSSQTAQANLSSMNDTMTIIGATLGAGIDFAAFAVGIDEADKAAAALTDTLNNLSIAGNLNVQMTGQMQEALFKVANVSKYSADQVGQAFTMLMERGQSAADVMNYTGEAVVNMAEAMGQNDATGAATLLSSVMQVYGIQADKARQTTDMLTYAFYHGIPDVQGLTAALNATSGMASAMHVPLSELLTMLDALGRAGLSGSQAGTAMRYMLSSMYEPTQKQANELQTLGIITAKQVTPAFEKLYATLKAGDSKLPTFDGTVNGLYNIWAAAKAAGELPVSSTFLQWADSLGMLSNKFYDANGKQIDFMKAFGILVSSIQAHSKTPQAFADSIAQMFNVRSGQGFADIVGHINTLSQKQKDLLISTEKQGLAAEDAAKAMDSQGNQMKALSTTWTDFLAQVGQPFQDFMKSAAWGLNQIVGGFTTGSPAVHQFFTQFLVVGAVTAGIALLVGLIFLIGTFASGIIVPVLMAAGAILALSTAVAGVGMVIQQHWSVLGPIISPVLSGIQNGLQGVRNFAQQAADALHQVNTATPTASKAQDHSKPLLDSTDRTHNAVLGLHAAVKKHIIPMAADWTHAWGEVAKGSVPLTDSMDRTNVGTRNMAAAANPLVPIFQAVGSMFSWLGKVMGGELGQAWKQLQPELKPLGAAFGDLMTALKPLLPYLGLLAVVILGTLIGMLVGVTRALGMFVLGVSIGIRGVIMIFTGLATFIHGFLTLLDGIFTLNGTKIMEGFKMMWSGIVGIVSGAVTAIRGVITMVFGAIGGYISGFIEGIVGFFQHLADTLVHHSIIPDMVNAILVWFLKIPTQVMGMIGGFISNVIAGAKIVGAAFQEHLIKPVSDMFSNLISGALTWGSNLIGMFINGIKNGVGGLLSFVSNNVVGGIKNLLGFHSPTKEGPGSDADTWMPNMMHMLTLGVVAGTPGLSSAAHTAALGVRGAFTSPSVMNAQGIGGGSAGSNTSVYNLNLDGKQVGQWMVDNISKTLTQNGIGRTLR